MGKEWGETDDVDSANTLAIAMTTYPPIVKPKDWYSSKLWWLELGVHRCNLLRITCEDLPIPAISLEGGID